MEIAHILQSDHPLAVTDEERNVPNALRVALLLHPLIFIYTKRLLNLPLDLLLKLIILVGLPFRILIQLLAINPTFLDQLWTRSFPFNKVICVIHFLQFLLGPLIHSIQLLLGLLQRILEYCPNGHVYHQLPVFWGYH